MNTLEDDQTIDLKEVIISNMIKEDLENMITISFNNHFIVFKPIDCLVLYFLKTLSYIKLTYNNM